MRMHSFDRRLVSVLLTLAMLLTLCLGSVALAETALPADGVYAGSGYGMHSNIVVSVTVSGGKIAAVEVTEQDETANIAAAALEAIPAAIVEKQSAQVDAVAGATMTSNGIMAAVEAALAGETSAAQELTLTPDLIVVGGGLAGLTASVRAAELGLNVLLLEASVRTGGCIHYAGGTISGANFKIQQENGMEDSPEAFYADIVALGGGESEFNPELSKSFCERSGAAIDWLDEDIGVDFGDRTLVAGAYTALTTLRVTRALGMYAMGGALGYLDPLTARLDEAVAEGKAQIMLNATVTELVVKDGKCTGVKVGDAEYSAPSVLLATGGYTHNEELLKMGGFENIISQAPKTSNGSGFYLAQAVGGVFDNMDKLVTVYGGGIKTDGFDMSYSVSNSYPGRVYVDKTGSRVGKEDTNDILMWKNAPENKLYVIISGNMIDPETVFIKPGNTKWTALSNNGWDKLEEMAAEGAYAFKADTVEELAEKLGAENLAATVEQYNADVAAGADSLFGRDADKMVAFAEGPYYAVETVPYVWAGSTGGVRANANGELVTADGAAIDGLFLAGEILGPTNLSGQIIFGGINHAMCVTFGLLAAENAAARAGK